MQPFKLKPAFKDYLWGGTRLITELGKDSELRPLAESWELSAHTDGPSTIADGEFAGMSFREFIKCNPQSMGTAYQGENEFPILIKLIDAKQSLSIQVHPYEDYAQRVEHEHGKTEMWVVLDSEPGAFIYYGFEHAISKEEMRRRIEDGSLTDVLHRAPCKAGDVFFIPAGTIHAIGAGLLIAEIQQSSNATYRVFDFGRLGADGKPRELHIQKALDVTTTAPVTANAAPVQVADTPEYRLSTLVSCDYFTTCRLDLSGCFNTEISDESFTAALCVDGGMKLRSGALSLELKRGETAFLPASCGSVSFEGNGSVLLASK